MNQLKDKDTNGLEFVRAAEYSEKNRLGTPSFYDVFNEIDKKMYVFISKKLSIFKKDI